MPTSYPDRRENPFQADAADRDPVRRLRGRLAAPVTIVTAGDGDATTGLTVSSLVVAEGEPGLVYFLAGPATDLFYAIETTRRFVVHVCEGRDRELADVFAGLRPSPGGMFAGRPFRRSEYGPVLDAIENRAHCTYLRGIEESYSVLVSGSIDRVEATGISDPLVYFRARYRALDRPDGAGAGRP